jgi:hypothetical protein
VIITDVRICWHDIQATEAGKHRSYNPLREHILQRLPEGSSVTIVPIIFTSRGTPPPSWTEICRLMKFKLTADALLRRIQTVLLTDLDEIMTSWTKQDFAHNMRGHAVRKQ